MQRSSAWKLFATVFGLASLVSAGGASAAPHPDLAANKDAPGENNEGAARDGERAYRYELRALGTYAGEAVFAIGAEETVGKRKLRPVRIDAFTAGLAANFLSGKTRSTAWVNRSWLPVRVRWDQVIDGVDRVVKASFDSKSVTGTDERGKRSEKVEIAMEQHGLDLVSVFPWLMQADLTPGAHYVLPVFDGRRIYQVTVDTGVAKEIQVPVGFRNAIPLKIRVERGEYRRDMELWISAEKDRAPLRMVFKYGLIGTVEANLVGEKKS